MTGLIIITRLATSLAWAIADNVLLLQKPLKTETIIILTVKNILKNLICHINNSKYISACIFVNHETLHSWGIHDPAKKHPHCAELRICQTTILIDPYRHTDEIFVLVSWFPLSPAPLDLQTSHIPPCQDLCICMTLLTVEWVWVLCS